MGTTARQIGSAMVWSMLARCGRFVLGMATSVIVVRSLGDEDYGVLSLVRTILMFVVVACGAGTGRALVRFLPTLRVERSARSARRLVRRVIAVHVVTWVVATGLTWLLRDPLEGLFDINGFGVLAMAAVGLALFELMFTLAGQILNSSYDTQRLSIASLVGHVVYLALLAVVLPRGGGVLGVVVASSLGHAASLLIAAGRIRPALRFGEDGDHRIDGGRVVRYSIPFALIALLNLVVWRQSETMLLAYFRTPAETGYFDLAYRIPQMILEFIPATVWPLVMAGMSEVYSRAAENLPLAIDRYYRMLFMLCAPICMTGMVLGGRMISILFGEAMDPAAIPAQVFFAVFTASFFSTPLSMALYVLERTLLSLVIYVGLGVVNVGLDLLLIPRYGVAGAVVPVALVIVASPFVYRVALGRVVDGVTIPWRFIGRCFLASSPVLLLVPVLGYIQSPLTLAAAFVVAAALVVFAIKKTRLLGEEEMVLLESIPVPLVDRLLRYMRS